MLVLDPLPVVIGDFETLDSKDLGLDTLFSPKNPEMGSHQQPPFPRLYYSGNSRY
jgi:glutaminyl-tRNA synthetase